MITTKESVEGLRATGSREDTFFVLLPSREQDELVALGRQVEFQAGATLTEQGSTSPAVFVLMKGFVKVLRAAYSENSTPVLIDICGPGHVLGAEVGMLGKRSHLSYVATRPVAALAFDQKTFQNLLLRGPRLMSALCASLAQRVCLRDASLSYMSHRVEKRLVAFLVRQQVVHGQPTENGILIDLGLSHSDIAAAIGSSEPAVGRVMTDLKEQGLITIGYRSIYIKKQLSTDSPPVNLPVRERRSLYSR